MFRNLASFPDASAKFPSALAELGREWNTQIQVNPTQSTSRCDTLFIGRIHSFTLTLFDRNEFGEAKSLTTEVLNKASLRLRELTLEFTHPRTNLCTPIYPTEETPCLKLPVPSDVVEEGPVVEPVVVGAVGLGVVGGGLRWVF